MLSMQTKEQELSERSQQLEALRGDLGMLMRHRQELDGLKTMLMQSLGARGAAVPASGFPGAQQPTFAARGATVRPATTITGEGA